MRTEFYLARRYLLTHRPGAWGWLISWMATGSVALGVASLIVTLAVMTGFREDIRQKILGVQPHVLLTGFNGKIDPTKESIGRVLKAEKRIEAWSPYIIGQVLIGHGSQTSGAMIKGIDPQREPKVAHLQDKLIRGEWPDLAVPKSDKSKPGIFLGQELARNLGARMGDTIWIVTPGSIGITAFSLPKAHLFVISGLVQTGLYDYDSSLAYIDLGAAQRVLGMEENVSGMGIRLKNPDDAEVMASELQIKFEGAYWVRSWLSLNRNLFSALKLEKIVMFIILTLVTVVASFMIVSNLLLSITQKVKEIGILRAMGAKASFIREVFLLQGALMGVVGTSLGAVLGVLISLILERTNLIRIPADVYYIDHLPIRLEAMDIVTVVVVACLIVLTATLYPAHRASRLDPLEAIRYG